MEGSLAATPEHHPVVPGSGGVRKARWKRAGRGYGKTEQEDLTYDEKKAIRRCVEAYKRASQTADILPGVRYH